MSTFKTGLTSIFFVLILARVSHASDQTFQATVTAHPDTEFNETQAVNFGRIATFVGAACSLGADGTVSGNCDSGGASASPGQINFSGITNNSIVSVSVTGGSSEFVTLTTQSNIQLGALQIPLADNTPVVVNVGANANNFGISVFGEMEVIQTLVPGSTYTNDYTVEVSFQ